MRQPPNRSLHGTGELVIDIDFVLEWLGGRDSGAFQFKIAPADLTFQGVSNLKISLDYASISAAMGAFSIDGIKKHIDKRDRYDAIVWTIDINFPVGQISFEASGFTQTLRSHAILVRRPPLSTVGSSFLVATVAVVLPLLWVSLAKRNQWIALLAFVLGVLLAILWLAARGVGLV